MRRAAQLQHERARANPCRGGRIADGIDGDVARRRQLADRVVQHPPDHRRVVARGGGHDDEEEPADVPCRTAARRSANAPTGPRRVMAAERELRHQRRHADDDRDERVEEDERGAAELSDHVREAPHVAEPDGHADDRHQRAEARREGFARCFAGSGHVARVTAASTSSARVDVVDRVVEVRRKADHAARAPMVGRRARASPLRRRASRARRTRSSTSCAPCRRSRATSSPRARPPSINRRAEDLEPGADRCGTDVVDDRHARPRDVGVDHRRRASVEAARRRRPVERFDVERERVRSSEPPGDRRHERASELRRT